MPADSFDSISLLDDSGVVIYSQQPLDNSLWSGALPENADYGHADITLVATDALLFGQGGF